MFELILSGKHPGGGTGAAAAAAEVQGSGCWSLARLLDMLRSWRNMFVHGGMWLLVGHLCSCWGEVFVTPGNNTRDVHCRFRRANNSETSSDHLACVCGGANWVGVSLGHIHLTTEESVC